MTNICGSMIVGAALVLGAAGGADAADIYRRGLKDTIVSPLPETTPHRWYARIDGGYAGYDKPSTALNMEGLQVEGTRPSIDETWTLGGGVGMYFSPKVRGDITYDHRFEGDYTSNFTFDPGFGYGVSAFRARVPMSSDLLLANLYYDFDCRCHFTPYVGVGLGAVRHSVKSGTFVSDNGTFNGTTEATESWHVAGALMAGFSVALRERLHLDAGYRFLYLGETSTGRVTIPIPGNGTISGSDATIEQLHAHEFRFGLRYDIR